MLVAWNLFGVMDIPTDVYTGVDNIKNQENLSPNKDDIGEKT